MDRQHPPSGLEQRLYFRQWLAGRDFARRDPVAGQMANFVHAVGDRTTGETLLVDPCYAVDELLAPPPMKLTGTTARLSLESLDDFGIAEARLDVEILYDTDDSSMRTTPMKAQESVNIVCLSTDESSMEISPAKLPRKKLPPDGVIDLCSP